MPSIEPIDDNSIAVQEVTASPQDKRPFYLLGGRVNHEEDHGHDSGRLPTSTESPHVEQAVFDPKPPQPRSGIEHLRRDEFRSLPPKTIIRFGSRGTYHQMPYVGVRRIRIPSPRDLLAEVKLFRYPPSSPSFPPLHPSHFNDLVMEMERDPRLRRSITIPSLVAFLQVIATAPMDAQARLVDLEQRLVNNAFVGSQITLERADGKIFYAQLDNTFGGVPNLLDGDPMDRKRLRRMIRHGNRPLVITLDPSTGEPFWKSPMQSPDFRSAVVILSNSSECWPPTPVGYSNPRILQAALQSKSVWTLARGDRIEEMPANERVFYRWGYSKSMNTAGGSLSTEISKIASEWTIHTWFAFSLGQAILDLHTARGLWERHTASGGNPSKTSLRHIVLTTGTNELKPTLVLMFANNFTVLGLVVEHVEDQVTYFRNVMGRYERSFWQIVCDLENVRKDARGTAVRADVAFEPSVITRQLKGFFHFDPILALMVLEKIWERGKTNSHLLKRRHRLLDAFYYYVGVPVLQPFITPSMFPGGRFRRYNDLSR